MPSPSVDQLLQSATTVSCVGPRPCVVRPLVQKGVKLGALCVLFSSLSVGTNAITREVSSHLAASQLNLTALSPAPAPSAPTHVDGMPSSRFPLHRRAEAASLAQHDDPLFLGQQLVQELKKKGLSAHQGAIALWHLANATNTVVLGRANPALERQIVQSQRQSAAFLARLEKSKSFPKGEFGNGWNEFNDISFGGEWDAASSDEQWEVVKRWWNLRSNAAFGKPSVTHYNPRVSYSMSVEQALTDVEKTTATATALAVVLPQAVASNTVLLQNFNQRLSQANTDLQQATGLTGGVLGLNFRVVLDTSFPMATAQTIQEQGRVHIRGWWDNLAHEWFHALDRAQAADMRLSIPGINLSRQNHFGSPLLLTFKDKSNLYAAQETLWEGLQEIDLSASDRAQVVAQLTAQRKQDTSFHRHMLFYGLNNVNLQDLQHSKGSLWLAYRRQAVEVLETTNKQQWVTRAHEESGVDVPALNAYFEASKANATTYLQDKTELLAFAFEASAATAMGPDNLLGNIGQNEGALYRPSFEEAKAQQKVWRVYFASLGNWWRADQQVRQATAVPVFSQTPPPPSPPPKGP